MTSNRTYLRTHPWLSFQFDFRSIPYAVCIALGEAQSKCEHISGVPLKPSVSDDLHKIYLAKGVLATTAIEGNTLSEEEALLRIEKRLELPPSREYLGQELDNVIEACNLIKDRLMGGCDTHISVDELIEYNKLILNKLPIKENVVPGSIRTYSVGVGSYRAAPAEDCDYLLDRFCNWLNNDFVSFDGNKIAFNIIKAIVSHIYFAWIHPFGDGNGRTARLIELKFLISAGVPAPAAHLLTNHYNQTRQEYYIQLDYASKSGGDLIPFIKYAVQGYVDGLREQLGKIRTQQFEVAWSDYVHEHFKDKNTPSDIRRRHLVLDLSRQNSNKPVPLNKLREISVRIAQAYLGKTKKTEMRDINYLVDEGLIIKTREGIKANMDTILAFLPECRKD